VRETHHLAKKDLSPCKQGIKPLWFRSKLHQKNRKIGIPALVVSKQNRQAVSALVFNLLILKVEKTKASRPSGAS